MKNDHRSKFSNLSNWKEEAWKNQGFNGIRTRDLRDTGAMLYQVSYEATHWEWGHSSLWSTTAVHILIISYILNAISLLIFFRLVLSNCLKWKIYCDDHSSLHIQPQYKYELFHIYFTSLHGTGKYELNKLTSLPMCGFIAQLVEHRTGIAEVPLKSWFFQAASSAVHIWIISYILHAPGK